MSSPSWGFLKLSSKKHKIFSDFAQLARHHSAVQAPLQPPQSSLNRNLNLIHRRPPYLRRLSTPRPFSIPKEKNKHEMASKEQPKIKLYWLNDSRAQNILWLLEELNLQYETEVFYRDPNRLAPPELAKVHPLGKAPVLEITPAGPPAADAEKPIILAESGYITQYLVDHFGRNKPSLVPQRWKAGREGEVGGETEAFARFQYLLHYVEGSFFPNFVQYLILSVLKSNHVPFLVRPITSLVANKIFSIALLPNAKKHIALLDSFLKTAPGTKDGDGYLGGPELSAADVLISFGLVTADHLGAYDAMGSWEGGSARAAYPVVFAYVDRLKKEPGYLRAREKAKEIEGEK